MMKTLFKVVSQTDPVTINTQNGTTQKSTVVLQEFGGKYEDSYVTSLLGQPTPNREQSSSLELPRCEGGKDAKQINQVKFYPGDIIWASLRFSAREYNGSSYQDITIQDFVSFTHH